MRSRPQPELRSALLARSSFKGYLCRLGEAPEKNLRSRMPFWQPRHHLRCPLSSSSRPQPSQPALKNPRRRKSAAITLLLSPRLRAKKGKANTGSCSSPATSARDTPLAATPPYLLQPLRPPSKRHAPAF